METEKFKLDIFHGELYAWKKGWILHRISITKGLRETLGIGLREAYDYVSTYYGIGEDCSKFVDFEKQIQNGIYSRDELINAQTIVNGVIDYPILRELMFWLDSK
jgi:hypothetical protein